MAWWCSILNRNSTWVADMKLFSFLIELIFSLLFSLSISTSNPRFPNPKNNIHNPHNMYLFTLSVIFSESKWYCKSQYIRKLECTTFMRFAIYGKKLLSTGFLVLPSLAITCTETSSRTFKTFPTLQSRSSLKNLLREGGKQTKRSK